MTESEKRVKAISLYDNWCETDTEDALEIYCYEQGREDERLKILGLVNFKYSDDERIRIRHIDISYDSLLSPEQVVCIILEQLKELKNETK